MDIEKLLHDFFKKFKWDKVMYRTNLYALSARKDGTKYANGAMGRDSLVKLISKSHTDDAIIKALHTYDDSAKDFVASFDQDTRAATFNLVARNFSQKFTRGCMNVFRYYLIYHMRKADEAGRVLTYKDKAVDLRDRHTQQRLYSRLLRLHDNDIAFRLCLAFSEEYRYKHIDFEHWLNLISYNYREITTNKKYLSENVLKDVNGILKLCCKFTLFLQCKGVFLYPKNWMCVPSSQGRDSTATYHLHRAILDKDFQYYLSSRYDLRMFHTALNFGLILNPWEFIQAEWSDYKNSLEQQSFKWGFINDVDEKIKLFSLERISDGK